MGKINVLDFEIANLIAAGEVVERPSSVVKELVENAIDSAATEITAEIKRGGVALIRVTDNGCGMTAEDLPVAIKRHATSKIHNRDDLDGITTLGFRGEALAAISAVSAVTIITKTADAQMGTMLTSDGGKILDISEVGSADGTTVVVENLFQNVPARRKFLKKDSTEAMNVTALMEKIALSKPDIAIRLVIDGEEKFATSGNGDLYDAVYSVLGKDFAGKLIDVDATAGGVRVHGFIGRSDNTRKNRNMENVFINGRYVKSLTAQAAIEKAYTSYIAPEAFPCCILFIEMSPELVDVNVHPTKLEVKFAGEQPVFEAIYHTVRSALEKQQFRPEISLSGKNHENILGAFVPIGEKTAGEQISFSPDKFNTPHTVSRGYGSGIATDGGNKSSGLSSHRQIFDGFDKPSSQIKVSSGAGEGFARSFKNESYRSEMPPRQSVDLLERYRTHTASSENELPSTLPIVTESKQSPIYRFVGEAYDCYLFVEYEGELLVIDKHAAHERVIFEDLLKMQKNDGRVTSQQLLLPITVILSPNEISALGEYADDMRAVGFDFELTDKYANVIATPDTLGADDSEELFVKMLDELIEGRGNPAVTESLRRERQLYQIACKAAIKGGRSYDEALLHWLIEKLLSIPDITVCPHGRPVAIKLKKSELDRQFDRIK